MTKVKLIIVKIIVKILVKIVLIKMMSKFTPFKVLHPKDNEVMHKSKNDHIKEHFWKGKLKDGFSSVVNVSFTNDAL